MHIDAHQPFGLITNRSMAGSTKRWPRFVVTFYLTNLKPQLENNGFQGTIVVQVRQTLEKTRWLLRLAETTPFILGVVGWLDLCSTQLLVSAVRF